MNLTYIFAMFKDASPFLWIGIVIFILLMILITLRVFRKSGSQVGKSLSATKTQGDSSFENVSESLISDESQVKVGAGLPYKCLCFRKIKGIAVADFTGISELVGELYQIAPSCPISGSGYVVRQRDDGVIEDYDPREVKMLVEDTPDYAWHAINWTDDVNSFWTVAVRWWKNTANWYAGGVLVLVFISILLVFG